VAKAFGKDGIQALELDALAPGISDTANRILESAYGDRFKIAIETTRMGGSGKKTRQVEDFITIEFNSENNLIQNNSENNSIQRLNVNVNGNENENANEGEIDFSNDPQKLFVHIWQHTPGIFNAFGRIESPNEWDHFWATAPPTCEEVRAIMQNVIDDVKDGRQDPHFIAKTPDRFVLSGGFVRHKKRRKPDKKSSPPPSLAGKQSLGDILDD